MTYTSAHGFCLGEQRSVFITQPCVTPADVRRRRLALCVEALLVGEPITNSVCRLLTNDEVCYVRRCTAQIGAALDEMTTEIVQHILLARRSLHLQMASIPI